MNEPKRRGRPPKPAPMNNAVEGGDVEYAPPAVLEVINVMPDITEAQAFAKAVWDAQSPDGARAWRISRVEEAMKNKGYSMEGIAL